MRNFSDRVPCICLGLWTPNHPPPPLFQDKVLKITEWLFLLKSLGLWTPLWTHLPIVWDEVPNKSVFFTPSLKYFCGKFDNISIYVHYLESFSVENLAVRKDSTSSVSGGLVRRLMENISNVFHSFYRTRVRSLFALVTNSLTD